MLKKVIRTFFNAPDPAHVRVRLRQINRFRDRFAGGASMPRSSRLFFNSLLAWGPDLPRVLSAVGFRGAQRPGSAASASVPPAAPGGCLGIAASRGYSGPATHGSRGRDPGSERAKRRPAGAAKPRHRRRSRTAGQGIRAPKAQPRPESLRQKDRGQPVDSGEWCRPRPGTHRRGRSRCGYPCGSDLSGLGTEGRRAAPCGRDPSPWTRRCGVAAAPGSTGDLA